MWVRLLALVAASVALIASGAYGQPADITINPGFTQLVQTPRNFRSLVVGDPELIEAIAETDRSFIIRAKREVGTTNIVVIGGDGQQMLNLPVRVTATVDGGTVRVFVGRQGSELRWPVRTFSCTDTACSQTDKPLPPSPIIIVPQMPAAPTQ